MSDQNTEIQKGKDPCPMKGLKKPSFLYCVMKTVTRPFAKLPGMSCRKYAEMCAGKKDCVLSFWQKLELAGHWLMCGVCRSFSKQIAVLDEMSQELEEEREEVSSIEGEACLSEEERARLASCLTEECEKE